MLQATLIGNIGADAMFQEKDGHKFVTFRVAHNDEWTSQDGQRHSTTMWIDCIMNDHPRVAQYLKQGQQVYVTGTLKTRVYSSEKDRCMKAGITINVQRVELLGGSTDEVPSRLYDGLGMQHPVRKFYLTDAKNATLRNQRGQEFITDNNGWVQRKPEPTPVTNQNPQPNDDNIDRRSENAPTF